jgi:hypothetical protein
MRATIGAAMSLQARFRIITWRTPSTSVPRRTGSPGTTQACRSPSELIEAVLLVSAVARAVSEIDGFNGRFQTDSST